MEMVERPLVYKRAIEMFAGPTPPACPLLPSTATTGRSVLPCVSERGPTP